MTSRKPVLCSSLNCQRSREHDRWLVDHEGDDPANGWRLYYAFPPGRPDCPVEQVRGLCDVRRL